MSPKTFDLTTDIQGLYADLLQLRARGGGDLAGKRSTRRSMSAVTKMNWSRSRDTTRIVFLVGDAPPHMDYAQDMKYPDVMRLARARDITVNTVQAGSARDTERYWREIAQMGRGEYMVDPAGRRQDRRHRRRPMTASHHRAAAAASTAPWCPTVRRPSSAGSVTA